MMRYNIYNETGVQWLGSIPEHWEVKRIKDILKTPLKYGANEPAIDDDKNNPRYIRITDFGENEILREDTFKSVKYEIAKNYLLQNGDILFARSGATVGKSFQFKNYDGLACYAGYLIKATPNTKIIQSDFLSYYTKSISYDEWKKNIFIQATIQNISAEKYDRLELMIPSIEEQTAIAQYLDTKTQAIDKKINLLTKKAEYYKELRKSIINNAVCKGLDKNVKLKESGIQWISKIPQHWSVERLKALGEIETSSVNKKIEEDEELVKLVNYTDVYGNMNKEIWNSDSYMVVSANRLQLRYKRLRQGDVLFTPSSETVADIGVSAVVMEDLKNTLYSYHILRLKFSKNMCLNFKKYLFNNDFVQEYFSKSATGTTRKILGLNTFYNLPVVFPPTIEEQTAIANYLDEKTQIIDAIVTNIGKQIETLKELRKTLINDVVTGKIKVTL